jgi:hypothetical protein
VAWAGAAGIVAAVADAAVIDFQSGFAVKGCLL